MAWSFVLQERGLVSAGAGKRAGKQQGERDELLALVSENSLLPSISP